VEIVTRISELKTKLAQFRYQGKKIGFVPTMGYLHAGHASLMRKAKSEQDVVIASIFVNPLQFGPTEDFAVYPRDLERDSAIATEAGADIIFAPSVEEMYPNGHASLLTYVDVQKVTERLCGASRPGHFRGVATVVAKLFHIVEPDVAYFGQKDAQQVVVLKRMVADLNMNVTIVAVPIVREQDGLAMSSRNVFLNPGERQAALVLFTALNIARDMLTAGERDGMKIVETLGDVIRKEPLASIDYISISDNNTLEELAFVDRTALIALAVRIGKTRLIDNFVWEA
jgi:pantoate--beta-alanine ligase